MRASQQRRINTTLDNYKKQGVAQNRITQQTIEKAAMQYQPVGQIKAQGLTSSNGSKARAGSNIRSNQTGNKLETVSHARLSSSTYLSTFLVSESYDEQSKI